MAVTRLADHLVGGTHAARPVATAVPVGTLYSCTDHSLIYQSDGATWSTYATLGASPLTTKGDLYAYSTANARLAVGSNGYTLVADSSATPGVAWKRPAVGVDVVPEFEDVVNLTTVSYDYEFDAADTTSLPSGWSWVNQGDSTYREVASMAALYALSSGGTTSANETHRMIVRSLPGGSAWTAVGKIPSVFGYPAGGDYIRGGLVLRDSAGGDYVFFGRKISTAGDVANVAVDYFSSLNTFSSTQLTDVLSDVPRYFKITKSSATSFGFAVSANGVGWVNHVIGYDPTADGLSLDQIGFLASGPSAGFDVMMEIDWFRVRT